jgi:hypothetical protein
VGSKPAEVPAFAAASKPAENTLFGGNNPKAPEASIFGGSKPAEPAKDVFAKTAPQINV